MRKHTFIICHNLIILAVLICLLDCLEIKVCGILNCCEALLTVENSQKFLTCLQKMTSKNCNIVEKDGKIVVTNTSTDGDATFSSPTTIPYFECDFYKKYYIFRSCEKIQCKRINGAQHKITSCFNSSFIIQWKYSNSYIHDDDLKICSVGNTLSYTFIMDSNQSSNISVKLVDEFKMFNISSINTTSPSKYTTLRLPEDLSSLFNSMAEEAQKIEMFPNKNTILIACVVSASVLIVFFTLLTIMLIRRLEDKQNDKRNDVVTEDQNIAEDTVYSLVDVNDTNTLNTASTPHQYSSNSKDTMNSDSTSAGAYSKLHEHVRYVTKEYGIISEETNI